MRYGTAGAKSWEAAQPHLSTINDVIIALAHNGTLVNTDELRRQLIDLGVNFLSNSDSEVAAKLIGYFTQRTSHLREGIRKTMELVRGGYAMALINEQALYAFRDPFGIRPLVLGYLPADDGCGGDGVPISTHVERAARARLPAPPCPTASPAGSSPPRPAPSTSWAPTYVRDIRPGEILRISAEGLVSEQGVPAAPETAECIFEQVYFARPDSSWAASPSTPAATTWGVSSRARRPSRRIWSSACPTRPAAGGGLRARERHPLWRGPHQEPLRGAHVHPAHAGARARWACA